METTVTYIAEPSDSRCRWFSSIIKPKYLTPEYLIEKIPLQYFRRGQDLELPEGTFLIDSEAVHHRKNQGYIILLGIVYGGKIQWFRPTMQIKMMIKAEGHQDLMKGSGDFVACIRMAIFITRQPNIGIALEKIRNAK